MTNGPVSCRQCGAASGGNFCASCGTPLGQRHCLACGVACPPDARHCPDCGRRLSGDAGASPPRTITDSSDRHSRQAAWLVGAFVSVALMITALVIVTAVRRSPSTTITTPDTAAAIAKLPPHERFLRLADRIQAAVQAGDTATVIGDFPMVEAAFAELSATERDIDSRFHLSLLRAEVGHFPGAVAQLDSIAALAAEHLLVDYLRALIADFRGDARAARAARVAFREHYDAELATGRPEYLAHRDLLEAFLATTPTN